MYNTSRDMNYEKVYHSLSIADISLVRRIYQEKFQEFVQCYNLKEYCFEWMFDWFILETLSRILIQKNFNSTVAGHYRHDIYKQVYEESGIFTIFNYYLSETPIISQIRRNDNEYIKVLVAGNNLVIAQRGTF